MSYKACNRATACVDVGCSVNINQNVTSSHTGCIKIVLRYSYTYIIKEIMNNTLAFVMDKINR